MSPVLLLIEAIMIVSLRLSPFARFLSRESTPNSARLVYPLMLPDSVACTTLSFMSAVSCLSSSVTLPDFVALLVNQSTPRTRTSTTASTANSTTLVFFFFPRLPAVLLSALLRDGWRYADALFRPVLREAECLPPRFAEAFPPVLPEPPLAPRPLTPRLP